MMFGLFILETLWEVRNLRVGSGQWGIKIAVDIWKAKKGGTGRCLSPPNTCSGSITTQQMRSAACAEQKPEDADAAGKWLPRVEPKKKQD